MCSSSFVSLGCVSDCVIFTYVCAWLFFLSTAEREVLKPTKIVCFELGHSSVVEPILSICKVLGSLVL